MSMSHFVKLYLSQMSQMSQKLLWQKKLDKTSIWETKKPIVTEVRVILPHFCKITKVDKQKNPIKHDKLQDYKSSLRESLP